MRSALLVACVLLPLGVVGARMFIEGREALAAAARLADRGDLGSIAERVALLGRAARRLGGPASAARAELAALGRRGVPAAFEELRGAILATRWLSTPDPSLLDEADHAIATRRAAEIVGRGGLAAPDSQQLVVQQARQLERLRATGEPSRALSLLAIVGLLGFVAAGGRLLFRGRSRAAVAGMALGFFALVVGLWRA